nr:immunoglobulin heavy chain junction region [Mus musculus]
CATTYYSNRYYAMDYW